MSRIDVKENFRVVVTPRCPGDFGGIYMSGIRRDERESLELCDRIAEQIRRHVDDLPTGGSKGVVVEWDTRPACEHCGCKWTEGDSPHNGGCCKKDIEVFERVEQEAAQ